MVSFVKPRPTERPGYLKSSDDDGTGTQRWMSLEEAAASEGFALVPLHRIQTVSAERPFAMDRAGQVPLPFDHIRNMVGGALGREIVSKFELKEARDSLARTCIYRVEVQVILPSDIRR